MTSLHEALQPPPNLEGSDCAAHHSYITYTVQLYRRPKAPLFVVITMLHDRTQSRQLDYAPFYDRYTAQEHAQAQADKYGLGQYADFTHFTSEV